MRFKKKAYIAVASVFLTAIGIFLLARYVHIYGGEKTIDPTCTEPGYTYRICGICGKVSTKSYIAPLQHDFSDLSKAEIVREPGEVIPGKQRVYCRNCNYYIEEYSDATSDMTKIYLDSFTNEKNQTVTQLRIGSQYADTWCYVSLSPFPILIEDMEKPDYIVSLFQDQALTTPATMDIPGIGEVSRFYMLGSGADITFSRNIVSSMIWADLVESRSGAVAEHLREGNAFCADFKPVLCYSNGAYHGAYSISRPLGPDTLALQENENSGGMQAMIIMNSSNTNHTLSLDRQDFTVLYSSDDDLHAVEQSLNAMLSFVNETEDSAEFRRNVGQYLDVPSMIDYIHFVYFTYATYNSTRNVIWATLDGQIWFPTPFYLFGTFGLRYDGSAILNPENGVPVWRSDGSVDPRNSSNLYKKIIANFGSEFFARYWSLRETVFDSDFLSERFSTYMSGIPQEAYQYEAAVWPDSPSVRLTSLEQITGFIQKRIAVLDELYNR